MGQRLSTRERVANACFCPRGGQFNVGWTVDQSTGHSVCSACGKPSPMTVFRVCAECGNEFVLPRSHEFWLPVYEPLESGKLVENEFFCTPCNPR